MISPLLESQVGFEGRSPIARLFILTSAFGGERGAVLLSRRTPRAVRQK